MWRMENMIGNSIIVIEVIWYMALYKQHKQSFLITRGDTVYEEPFLGVLKAQVLTAKHAFPPGQL